MNKANKSSKQRGITLLLGVVRGGLVKIVEEYITKGKEIAIEGKLTNRSWDDKDGVKRYTTEIICNELLMLSK